MSKRRAKVAANSSPPASSCTTTSCFSDAQSTPAQLPIATPPGVRPIDRAPTRRYRCGCSLTGPHRGHVLSPLVAPRPAGRGWSRAGHHTGKRARPSPGGGRGRHDQTGRIERRMTNERAMRPLRVVVLDEDAQDALEVAAIEDQQPVETFDAGGSDETLGDGVCLRRRTGVLMIRMPALRNTSWGRCTCCRGDTHRPKRACGRRGARRLLLQVGIAAIRAPRGQLARDEGRRRRPRACPSPPVSRPRLRA